MNSLNEFCIIESIRVASILGDMLGCEMDIAVAGLHYGCVGRSDNESV